MARRIIARYQGQDIPVDNTTLTPEEFGEVLADEWPELRNCRVNRTTRGNTEYWDYSVIAGSKG